MVFAVNAQKLHHKSQAVWIAKYELVQARPKQGINENIEKH